MYVLREMKSMNRVLDILKDRSLTYHQQIKDLAAYAESTIEVLNIDDETKKLIDEGCICTLLRECTI